MNFNKEVKKMPKESLNCEIRPSMKSKCISADSFEKLEELINEFLENETSYIREIRPIAFVEVQKPNPLLEGQWIYENHFGVVILYEPTYKESKYIPPSCEICKKSEDDVRGTYIGQKFYCNICLKEKLEQE